MQKNIHYTKLPNTKEVEKEDIVKADDVMM
jgi:hypothetical protein